MIDVYLIPVDSLGTKARRVVAEAANAAEWQGPAIVSPAGLVLKYFVVPTDVGLVHGTDRAILPSTAELGPYDPRGVTTTVHEHPYGQITIQGQIWTHHGVLPFHAHDPDSVVKIEQLLAEGQHRTDTRRSKAQKSGPSSPPHAFTPRQVPPVIATPPPGELGLAADGLAILVELRSDSNVVNPGQLLEEGERLENPISIVQRHVPSDARAVALVDELNNVLISYIAGNVISISDVNTVMGLEDRSPDGTDDGLGLNMAAFRAFLGHPRISQADDSDIMANWWRESPEAAREFVVWSAGAILRFAEAGLLPLD